MRLINADALQEQFDEIVGEYTVSEIQKFIDNAPTVCGNNPKWCESCISKGKCASTRPTGKWI